MTSTTVPETGSVDYYAQHIRDQIAEGVDMYAYAFGYATAFATSPVPPVDALQCIANIAEAVKVIEGEQRAAFAASFTYSRADSEPDDPTPVSPARAPLHVGVMDDGGLVDVTPCYVANGFQAPEVIDERRAACRASHPGRECTQAGETSLRHFLHPDRPVTLCGTSVYALPGNDSYVNTHEAITCKACIDGLPF